MERASVGEGMNIDAIEKETIITFNESEKVAQIFTYSKTWQKHLEKKIGLKPVKDNGAGAKEYEIDKKRIPMPRSPRKLSNETKQKAAERLQKARDTRIKKGI